MSYCPTKCRKLWLPGATLKDTKYLQIANMHHFKLFRGSDNCRQAFLSHEIEISLVLRNETKKRQVLQREIQPNGSEARMTQADISTSLILAVKFMKTISLLAESLCLWISFHLSLVLIVDGAVLQSNRPTPVTPRQVACAGRTRQITVLLSHLQRFPLGGYSLPFQALSDSLVCYMSSDFLLHAGR